MTKIVPMALDREAELLEVVAEEELGAFDRTIERLHARAVELERRWLETDDGQ